MILALDVGDKRIGSALSDEAEKFAYPYRTFARAAGEAERLILQVLSEKPIDTLVVGLPLNADNSRNEQCQKIERFAIRLLKRWAAMRGTALEPGALEEFKAKGVFAGGQLRLEFVDEYGSSADALERLQRAGSGKKAPGGTAGRQKSIIDAAAAAVILQDFIDARTRRGSEKASIKQV